MNREQRRKFKKGTGVNLPKNNISGINHGDKVMLDVDFILADKDRDNPLFVKFVESSREVVYHAIPMTKLHDLIGLEESNFIFHYKDIIKLNTENMS